ncbi:MAG: cytochrome P450 [Actinobacteria bacterium]|nr:cytochrome P450 [Actinomycetota bacterium]
MPDVADVVGADWARRLLPSAQELMARDARGLHRIADNIALAFRHEDVRTLAADPNVGNTPAEVLTAKRGLADPATSGFGPILVNQMFVYNPPLHTEIRRIATRQMTPGNIGRFSAVATAVVRELLDGLAARDDFDVVIEYAEPVATRFWGRLFGLTPDEILEMQRLNTVLSKVFLAEVSDGQYAAIEDAVAGYMQIITTAISGAMDGSRTCAEPGRELLADIAADLEHVTSTGGPRDLAHFVAGNFFDGFHPIGVGLGTAIAELLMNETERARVVADAELSTRAYDEGTRLAPPLILTHRTTLCDVDYHGVHLPQGTMIAMHWGAANIDPDAFEDPLRYDLDRRHRGLLTFGAGPHLCPGRNAARLVGDLALREFVRTFPEIVLDGPPEWVDASSSAQLVACRVRCA